jgi:uncharacterized iron-regulated membrane protein
MNRRHLVLFGGCLLAAAALLAAAWVWWDRQPPRETWEVERPERVLSEFAVGQEVKVLFALRNRSSRTLRLLGTSAC